MSTFRPDRLQIKLSTKSFGSDAAEVAAQGIANIISTLEEADLSDIIAGPPPALCTRTIGPCYPPSSDLSTTRLPWSPL